MRPDRRGYTHWIRPVMTALSLGIALVVLTRWIDFGWLSDQPDRIWQGWFVVADAEAARAIILSILEVLAGVFAITITVVAIIVQLSATRYTPRVVDLFLADRYNRAILFVYVVPMIYGFWLADAITPEAYPRFGVTVFIIMASLAIVLVIPYFSYVFRFLQPANIIAKIEAASQGAISQVRSQPGRIGEWRREVAHSIQQLGDISQSSIAESDIALALDGLNSLKFIATDYLAVKPHLPEAWFEVDESQVLGLSDDGRADLVRSRVWVEMLIFKRYELVFTSSLRRVRDITSCVAMNLRQIGVSGLVSADTRTLDFVIKGFNTLVMYALSERDIRSAVHVFYQYRLLAESVLDRPEVVGRIAEHFRYYGQNSQRRGIYFIMDAVAFDLRILITQCMTDHPDTMEVLLATFLELDQAGGDATQTNLLKGVRKSQAILGAFFIRHGRADLARRVISDMGSESSALLMAVRKELFETSTREFWEIEDRGVSFYYVAEDERESVAAFFSLLGVAETAEPGAETRDLK